MSDMIPGYCQSLQASHGTTSSGSMDSKTLLNQHLSTSPHSFHASEAQHHHNGVLTSNQEVSSIVAQIECSLIELSIHGQSYVLNLQEGERCLFELEKMMQGWNIRAETKMCLKLIIAKKLTAVNVWYEQLFLETVQEYQQFKINQL